MYDIIPKGWTRGGAVRIHTAPSPWLADRDLAVATPIHPVADKADSSLRFTDVEGFEEWRKWWFAAPVAAGQQPVPGSFEPAPQLIRNNERPAIKWGSLPQQPVSTTPAKKPSPFDAPKPAPVNPFATPKKPVNPFERK